MSVEKNLQHIQEKIIEACKKVNRDPHEIMLIGVTKYTTIEKAEELIQNGVINLGENRDQEFLSKYEVIGNRAEWHFIGTLQSRKVKNIIDKVDYIHSLDRLSLAKEIDKRATKKINCLVQVNVSEEESKHGLKREETIPFIENLAEYQNIRVIGLMTMAPNTDNENILRKVFRDLKKLQEEVQNLGFEHAPCDQLSMGMSNDFEIAIEEGATMIRIGSLLVGEN